MPPDYVRVSSGLGGAAPQNIIILPVVFEGQVKGVLELASLERFNPGHQAFLDQLTESIGIVLNTIQANMRTEGLLKQSQSLAQQLQTRQEELQNTNQELQEKAGLLAHQNQEVERKNQEVEQARQALEEKAKQLALTSKYKSEFLANMSHELRTPLNSLLILSDQMSKNPEGNLTPRQTEFSKTIHSSGNDLLMLINDILDLSKIESGTVVVDVGELRVADLHNYVERTFRHVAESKSVDFSIELDPHLPKFLLTDSKRLQQIIKNLLSNAFKFTQHGRVALTVEAVSAGWNPDNESLNLAAGVVAFSVSDTGIGIPPDKQQIIFEAFQQADGSTSRKFGGTGLGLAISREISRLLGGEIRLVSAPGRGSTFTLYLPQVFIPQKPARKPGVDGVAPAQTAMPDPAPAPAEELKLVNEVGDDRATIRSGDRVLLIVENDLNFARFMLETAREKGFKGLVTSLGAAALAMARDYKPDAVTLDIHLPDIDGWRVLERLKNEVATRHIPVCVISTEEARARGLKLGAMAVVSKPIQTKETLERTLDNVARVVSRPIKDLLVVGSDEERRRVKDAIGEGAIHFVEASTGAEALEALRQGRIDAVVLHPGLPDMTAATLAEEIAREPALIDLPLVVYSERPLDENDDFALKALTGVLNVWQAGSPDRLLDQTALLLHCSVAKLPEAKRKTLEDLHKTDKALTGKKVLIVDDDIRNIFALTSVLECYHMNIVSAETGREAIRILQEDAGIDIVLMDIMMPEMDGLDTMKVIRTLPAFKTLPIIAVTAKAMKGDREKCIEAGAWDYLSKPVDTEQMLSLLRGWLHR